MDLRGLVLLSCLASSFAAPLSSSKCDPKCIVPSGFQEGQTYVYSYHTETATYMQGEDHGFSNLTVSCQANVEVVGTCELVLEVRDISVTETNKYGDTIDSPNVVEFKHHLQAHRLRFGMKAGEITSVCPSSEEDVWVTNFKRGILSALQFSLPSTAEDDEHYYDVVSERSVSGICPTEMYVYDSEIIKEKDFTKCENRFSMEGSLQGIKLFPRAPTSTIVSSFQRCRQEYSDGDFITFSTCEERHVLKPMPNQEIGPITSVLQTLTFDHIISYPSNHLLEAIESRKDILYEHHMHMEMERTDSSAATAVLDELCQSLSGGVDSDTARLYPALVHEMRRLELTALSEVIAATSCEGYERSLMQITSDALETCQSSACVEVMVNLIQNDVLQDEDRIKSWLSSLHFIRHPTKEMVASLMQLTEKENLRSTLYLSLSSVMNKYCQSENLACTNVQEISDAMNLFESSLVNKCRYVDRAEKKTMMLSIRAIGNAAIPSRSVRKCFEYSSTDIALRIAAIQATEQMPCDSVESWTEELTSILRQSTEDSEVRITAYRALMACPTMELLDLIIDDILEGEQSNQVGGYIVSHLKNIQSSQDPLKADQRFLLLDHPITAKFLDESMKFSRNFELSWFNETSGYGIAGESDVIFSSDSFIPRQVSIKGQVDALGYAFEAFEIGGRVEGLHNYLESLFNPLFPDMTDEDDVRREKRTLIKENRLANVRDEFEVHDDGEADGSLYLKIFGQEILFMDTDDFKKIMEPTDMTQYMIELALLAQGRTYDVTNSYMMAEHSISLPLVNGFNLKFATNGSSTDRLKVTGKVDILGMFMTSSMEIDGTVEPSFAFDISSTMEVDAHCSRIGVHFDASGHSATSISGKIMVENGNNVQIKLRAPEQKQEILSMSSKVYFLHQDQKDIVHKSIIPLVNEKHCTGEFLEDAMGFKICGESSFHRQQFVEYPLSGTYQFSLTAEKVEQDLDSFDVEVSYELKQKMVDEVAQNTDTFHLMFGTPDTEIKRTYSVDFEYNREERNFIANLQSPKHSCDVDANGIELDHFDIHVTVDEESEYLLYFNMEKGVSSEQTSYRHTLRMESPQFGTLSLTSSVIDTPNEVNIDAVIGGEIRQFVTVSGSVSKSVGTKKSRYDSQFTIGGEYLQGSTSGVVNVRDGAISFDGTLQKETMFGEPKIMEISAKHSTKGTQNFNQNFYISCAFLDSPQSDFRLDGEIGATGLNSASTIKYCYGQTTCNHRNKIILSHLMAVTQEDNFLSNSLSLTYEHPALDSHMVFTQNMRVEGDVNDFTMSVIDRQSSPPVVLVASRIGCNIQNTEEGKYGSSIISLTTPDSVKMISHSWAKTFSTGEGSLTTTVQWHEGEQVVSAVSYSKGSPEDPGSSRHNSSRHNIDAVVTYPDESTHNLHSHFEKKDEETEVELSFHTDKEEKFYVHGQVEGETASLRTRTPFTTLPDSLLSFTLNRHSSDSFDAIVSFKSLPKGYQYSVTVGHTLSSLSSLKSRNIHMTLGLPTSTFTLTGFAVNNLEMKEKKGGVGLTVINDDMEVKVFGIEGKFHDRSNGSRKDLLLRLNSTAPYHENAIQLTLMRDADEGLFNSQLTIEYSKGQNLISKINFSRKTGSRGFLFAISVDAPFQSALLRIDHSKSDNLFNPHFTFEITSFGVDITLLDVNMEVSSVETIYGKNSRLHLNLTGPGKTLILLTGIERSVHGMNYYVQLANKEEVRFRLDLDTTVRNENRFQTDVTLSASSIYAENTPINCGIHLSQGGSGVSVVVDFNVNEIPLFIFNISKTSTSDLPHLINEGDLTIRVKLPTSINDNLHNFGVHLGREEERINGKPRKSGSISFFWGPELNQQFTVSSTSELVNDDELGWTIEGSLVMVQPLRIPHLYPEYSLEYSITKTDSNMEFDVSYSHGSGNSTKLLISHSRVIQEGITNYITSVNFRAQQGNMLAVTNTLAVDRGQMMRNDVVFILGDGDDREQAELTIEHINNSDENLDFNVAITFEHSPSGLDLTVNLGIQNSDSLMDFGLEGLCSIPALDSPVNLNLEIEFNKLTKATLLHIQGPVNNIILRGNAFDLSQGDAKSFRLETTNDINGDRKRLNVQINYEDKAGDVAFEMNNAGDRVFHFGYLNDSAIQVALTKEDDELAQVTVNLLNPHTLYSLITWDTEWPAILMLEALERIDVLKDMLRETCQEYSEIGSSISEDFETYLDNTVMRNDIMISNMNDIKDSLQERLTEMKLKLQEQREEFKNKFIEFKDTTSNNLQPLFEEYETMRDIGRSQLFEMASQMEESILSYFEDAGNDIIRYQKSVGGELYNFIRKKQRSIENNVEYDRNMIITFREEKRELLQVWSDSEVDIMRMAWDVSRLNLQDRFAAFTEHMSESFNTDRFDDMNLELMMSPFYSDSVAITLKLKQMRNDFTENMEELRASREERMSLLENDLFELYEIEYNFQYIKAAPSFGIGNSVKPFDTIIKNVMDNLQDKLMALKEWAYAQSQGYTYNLNIEDGTIEIWLYTDARFDDLISAPYQDPIGNMKVALTRLSEDFPLLKTARKYKSTLYNDKPLVLEYLHEVVQPEYPRSMYPVDVADVWQWNAMINTMLYKIQPPMIRGRAFLLGNQHYMTFDGTYYEFSGKCSYLLAHDFVDNNFTIAVEYNRDENVMSKRFVVMVDEVTIELSDNRILVNQREKELPYMVGDYTKITREFTTIHIASSKGFTVSYNIPDDMLTVDLSIFYYGKTAGLFGNFNYEPNDDLIKVDGEVASDVSVFTPVWEIGKRCGSHLNKAVGCDISPSLVENRLCAGTFLDGLGSTSPGHPAVNPEPYYTMCANRNCHIRTDEEQQEERCRIFNAYARECLERGVAINIPSECVRCMKSDEESYSSYTALQVDRGSDIVVILEEEPCMANRSPQVKSVMSQVHKELKREGLTQNRFGIVGFGGSNINEPHAQTMEGELFGSSNRLISGLDGMQFNGKGTGDYRAAIAYAMNYPFRAGVDKHIIFMACSDCPEKRNFMGSRDFSKAMNDQGITFSIFMNHTFTLGEIENKEDGIIYGVDRFGVFTEKHVGLALDEFKSDRSLNSVVNRPKNSCTKLAQATSGSVFDISSLGTKNVRDIFALWVVKNSHSEENNFCICKENNSNMAQSICEY